MFSFWHMTVISVLLFFFFQAEDGIRDLTVTGVQTCALPICYTLTPAQYAGVAYAALAALTLIVLSGAAVRLSGSGLGCPDWPKCYGRAYRSEERRVGKEGRSRWSPYHLKKKKKNMGGRVYSD